MIRNTRVAQPEVARDAGGLGGPLAGLLFTAAIAGAGRLAEDPFPGPGSSAEETRTYYTGSRRAARFNVACQAVSIVAQSRYLAAMARIAGQHSRHPRLLSSAVTAAGGIAVAALTASAAVQASLTLPGKERDDAELLATTRRVFVLGGPIHGVANSVFTAATVMAGRDAGLLGRTATVLGLVSAAANLLTPAYFRWEPAGWLIPIGRFSSYLLSGVIGARLAVRRTR